MHTRTTCNTATVFRRAVPPRFVFTLLIVSLLSRGSRGVVINEFMAANAHFSTDEAGQFDDWVELYNEADTAVDIGGYYLTDNLTRPARWMIPLNMPALTLLPAHAHLLIWLDNDPGRQELHATFKLDADNEQLGLFAADGSTPVDTLSFSGHLPDQSYGRYTDGSANWTVFTRPTPGDPNSNAAMIREFRITCKPDDLRYIYRHPREDHYIPITLTLSYGDRSWSDVRMRIRGDSSRDLPKKSLKIKFDGLPFVDGRDVLNFNADYLDPSYMHNVMASYSMRASGQPCFIAEHARIVINGSFSGLYIAIENMDEHFLERNNLDPDGNLYKATKDGSCLSPFDDIGYHWEKKTNTQSDRKDLQDLITSITTVPDSLFESFIRKTFFYDNLINIMAMNILINNGSTYYHNYYLYHDINNSNRWMMLPWDMDLTFWYSYDLSYHRTSKAPTSDNMLIERALANERIRTDVRARIDTLYATFLNDGTFYSIADSITPLILPSVMDDNTDDIPDTAKFNLYRRGMCTYPSHRYTILQEQFEHWPLPFRINPSPLKRNDGITFSWAPSRDPDNDPVTYAFKYSRQVNLDDSSTTVIHSGITDTCFTLAPSALPEGTWYWTVIASDGSNTCEGYNTYNTLLMHPGGLFLSQPEYYLSISTGDLSRLKDDPFSDTYYPATLTVNTVPYECKVRFRGTTARAFPKKSFRIKFPDRNNLFGAEAINLNAESRDHSMMRNHLAMRMFEYAGQPAPRSQYVNLFLNGAYYGVFLHMETIDNDFLSRNGRKEDALYKAVNHGACMAPILNHDDLMGTWEKKIGVAADYSDIKSLLNKVYYWSREDFENQITDLFDVENVLTYFAIQLALVSFDGMTKNMYLYHNPDIGKWELFPWDIDASLGNFGDGSYIANAEQIILFDHFTSNVLIQRLLEYPVWDRKFIDIFHDITSNGFTVAEQVIDSLFPLVKNDILQDVAKDAINKEFLDEIDVLKEFMSKRRAFTRQYSSFSRPHVSDWYISTPMPDGRDTAIIFRVRTDSPDSIFLVYSKNIDFTTSGAPFSTERLELFDDGNHNDLLAGDSIFGTILPLDNSFPALVPYAIQAGRFTFPPNGLFYQNRVPTRTYGFARQPETAAVTTALQFDTMFAFDGNYTVILSNSSASPINLSAASMRSGACYNVYHFPPVYTLEADSSVALISSSSFARTHFSDRPFLEHFDITLREGDTLTLLSPSCTPLIQSVIAFTPLPTCASDEILINEINYHSASEKDAGDWVELYNPNNYAVDVSGWRFCDSDTTHVYTFPEQTVIEKYDYAVICSDYHRFDRKFGSRVNGLVTRDFDFGLSSAGETLSLYDHTGSPVNQVRYSSAAPWPSEAFTGDRTLSLINYTFDNTEAESWQASPVPGGTPGRWNGCTPFNVQKTCTVSNHLNVISFFLPAPGKVTIALFDLNGRNIRTIVDRELVPDTYSFRVTTESMSSGFYLLQVAVNGKVKNVKNIIITR